MTVVATRLDVDRDVYEVSYNDPEIVPEIVGEEITAEFTNAADGDKSTYAGINDGKFIVTVAKGYVGSDSVTIRGADGGEVTGSITFGGTSA